MKSRYSVFVLLPLALILLAAENNQIQAPSSFLGSAESNSQEMIQQGRHIFRFDTFADQTFWHWRDWEIDRR